jgi:Holliday junction resolvase-like predicted endonuclease
MMSPSLKRKAEKEARLYLEMRGYEILELNWGLSRNKIDVITLYKSKINFVEVDYIKDLNDSDQVNLLTQAHSDRLRSAAEAWLDETKYSGDYTFSRIELTGPNFSVLSFNEVLI